MKTRPTHLKAMLIYRKIVLFYRTRLVVNKEKHTFDTTKALMTRFHKVMVGEAYSLRDIQTH